MRDNEIRVNIVRGEPTPPPETIVITMPREQAEHLRKIHEWLRKSMTSRTGPINEASQDFQQALADANIQATHIGERYALESPFVDKVTFRDGV